MCASRANIVHGFPVHFVFLLVINFIDCLKCGALHDVSVAVLSSNSPVLL